MTLKDKIKIQAPALQIWSWLADPRQMMHWNPKLDEVEPISRGPVGVGYEFMAAFSFSGRRKTVFSAKVLGFEVARRWVCQYDQPVGEKISRDLVAIETCELVETSAGIQVS